MKLYHFTEKNIKDKIKVSCFADNLYTNRDKQASDIKRAFFFIDSKAPEYRFVNSKYRYIVNIDSKDIYNLKQDKKHYKKRYNSIDKILRAIKRDYRACIYSIGYDIVISFYDITINKKGILK